MGRTVQRLRRSTLGELEGLFAGCFPPELLSQREEDPNSREQIFTLRRTFWRFLFQMLTPHTAAKSCAMSRPCWGCRPTDRFGRPRLRPSPRSPARPVPQDGSALQRRHR